MGELKYFVAYTVDRYIAAEDGSIDAFLNDGYYFADLFESFPEACPGHLREALGVRGENKQFGDILMGRKTYEAGLKAGVTDPYPTLKQYVFSSTMKESPDDNVTLVSESAAELVAGLKDEAGKDIWLAGGASLATSLFSEGLVDELILKVNPVVLGSGIPLFSGTVEQTRLELTDSRIFKGGVPMLRYRVKR
jgi:dihydrofolate reductase